MVLGVYLHGSATLGGLKPASDLDVLAVTDRSLNAGERRDLVDELLLLSDAREDGWGSVELTVVVQSQVRPWRYPPVADFLFGDWLRADIEANGPPQPGSMPNLAIELPQLLAHGITISGPDSEELLDPVPAVDTVRGSLDGIPSLLSDLVADTRNVLLTLARIWATVATGQVMSKDSAAGWALRRLPAEHRPVLEHARALYLTTSYTAEAPWGELATQVQPHVEEVLGAIDRLIADHD